MVEQKRLGQSDPTPHGHDTGVLARRFSWFGWRTIEIDGHDITAILDALRACHNGGPTAIVARTKKGKGGPSWKMPVDGTANH